MPAHSEWTFAYGSNMNLDDFQGWLNVQVPEAKSEHLIEHLKNSGKVAILRDHQLVWNYYSSGRKGGAANIQEVRGVSIHGVAFPVDTEQLKLFDKKEGHPTYYVRQLKEVTLLQTREQVYVWIYYASPSKVKTADIWPTNAYKNTVLEGAKYWNLPKEYQVHLSNIPTQSTA